MDSAQTKPQIPFPPSFLFASHPVNLRLSDHAHSSLPSPSSPKKGKVPAETEAREDFLSEPFMGTVWCDQYTLPELYNINTVPQSQSFKTQLEKASSNFNLSSLCKELEAGVDKALQNIEAKAGSIVNLNITSNSAQEIQKKVSELGRILKERNKVWHSLVTLDKLSEDLFEVYRAFDKNTRKFYYVKQIKKTKSNESQFEKVVLSELKLHLQQLNTEDPSLIDLNYQPREYFSLTYELGRGTLKDYLHFIKRRSTVWDESILLSFIKQIGEQADKISKSGQMELKNLKTENISINNDWTLKLYNCTQPAPFEKTLKKQGSLCLLTEIDDSEVKPDEEVNENAELVVKAILEVIQADAFNPSKVEEALEKVKARYPKVSKTIEKILETRKIKVDDIPVNIDFFEKLEKYYQEYLASRIYQNLTEAQECATKIEDLLELEGMEDWCDRTTKILSGRNQDEKQRLGSSYFYLGKACLEKELYTESLDKFHKALSLYEEVYGKASLQVAELLSNLGILYMKTSDLDGALKAFERADEIYCSLKLEYSPQMAVLNDRLGDGHFCRGKLGEALLSYEKGLEIRLISHETKGFSGSYAKISAVYEKQGYLDKALSTQVKALDLLEKAEKRDKIELASCYDRVAYLYRQQNKLDLALTNLQKAFSLCIELFGPLHIKTIAVQTRIAVVHLLKNDNTKANQLIEELVLHAQDPNQNIALQGSILYLKAVSLAGQGKVLDSMEFFERVLKLYTESEKKFPAEIASCMIVLGNFSLLRGDLLKGHEQILRAHNLRTEYYGSDHDLTKRSQIYLGLSYYLHGQYQDSIKFFEKALNGYSSSDSLYLSFLYFNTASTYKQLKRRREALEYYQLARDYLSKVSPDHPQLASCVHNLADLFYKSAKFDIALQSYKRALEFYEKNSHENISRIAACQVDIGHTYLEMGLYVKAQAYFEKAYDIRKKCKGEFHPLTIDSLNNIGITKARQGRNEEALTIYQRCLDERIKIFGAQHKRVADIYSNIGNSYLKLNRNEDAMKTQKKAFDIRVKVLPKYHHKIGDSYLNMGTIYNNMNKLKEAIESFESAIKVYQKTYGEKHPSIANCYTNLAIALKSQGKTKESRENFEKALNIYVTFYPKDHPNIKNVRSQLGSSKPELILSPNKKRVSPEKKHSGQSAILAKIVLQEANKTKSPAKKDSKFQYRMQLENLKELGFMDEEKNLKILMMANGNIAEAMKKLNN